MSNLILTGDFDPAITYQTTPVSFTFNESASYEIRIDLSSDTFKNVGFVEFEFKSPQPLSDANIKYIEAYDEDGTTRIKQQEAISKTDGLGWSRCHINTFYCDAASNTIYIRFIGISDDEEHTAIIKNFRFGDPDLGKSVVTIASDDEITIDPVSSNYVLDNGSGYTFSYEYATDRVIGNVIINDVYQKSFSTTGVTVSSISENKEIYAETFGVDDFYYTVDITSTGGGTVYPTGHVNVVEGYSLFVDPTPLSGNMVSSITVDGTVYPTWIVDYTFENITDNHTIEVAFASGSPTTYTITETHTDGGYVFPSGAVSTTHGKNVTYTFFPDTGYTISDVTIDGVSIGTADTYQFASVSADHTVHAVFDFDESYFVTLQIKGGTYANLVSKNAAIRHRELVYDSTNNILRIGNNADYRQDFASTSIIGETYYVKASEVATYDGICPLDSSALIPASYIPSSITGAVSYKGTFDPSGGTAPTPAAQGYYYVASTTGTVSTVEFATGDWLVYRDDTNWDKLNNSTSSVPWTNVSGKPSTFTPSSHGNESHSSTFIDSTGVTYEALLANSDIGSGATQVAQGNHNHTGVYLGVDGKAADSELLDSHDSTYFATTGHNHDATYLGIHATADDSTEWGGFALPSTSSAFGEQILRLNSGKTAFEFATVEAGVAAFIDLTDAPSSYTGFASAVVMVSDDADGLVFKTLNAIGYSSVSETITLPASPAVGQIYELIGTGTNWTITRSGSQTIQMLSVNGTVLSSSTGYDCAILVYIGSSKWVVKSSMGVLDLS